MSEWDGFASAHLMRGKFHCHPAMSSPTMARMPHLLTHGGADRREGLSGLVGRVCFYLAFFLDEDEQGRLQNRIEGLWISAIRRAKGSRSNTSNRGSLIGASMRIGPIGCLGSSSAVGAGVASATGVTSRLCFFENSLSQNPMT